MTCFTTLPVNSPAEGVGTGVAYQRRIQPLKATPIVSASFSGWVVDCKAIVPWLAD